jgi:transaldolase/glucose-6-phosphate isomerase
MTDFAIEPGAASAALDTVFSQLDRLHFVAALWARRLDVWTTDWDVQQAIANRLGWLDAIEFITGHLERIEAFARSVRASGLTDVVLFGMGGSSLAPEVFHRALGRADELPRFRMLDSTDPVAVRDALANAGTSMFVIASKSGTTLEPNSMAAAARRRVETAGVKGWASRFVAITDENTDLHRRALNDGFLEVFVNPSDVGGRYSALTFFGMVPAALMGIPLAPVVERARMMLKACYATDARTNPAVALGALMGAAAKSGRDKLTLLVPDRLESFGLWGEQLVAESTGKQGKGIVPIAGETTKAPAGDDRMAVVVRIDGDGPDDEAVDRMRAAGVPLMTIDMPDMQALGAEFFRWEIATATAGRILEINPFDEPNVQQAKEATHVLLQAYTTRGELSVKEPDSTRDGIRFTLSRAARERLGANGVDRFLSVLAPRDYFALLAYVPPDDPVFGPVLRELRNRVAVDTRCATMFSYGPRYLHSTGQLHKGGPNTGVFVIVTAPAEADLPIPGAPYSFGVLEMAQALGDFHSLDAAGRRVMHAHLPDRHVNTVKKLADLITGF